LAIAKLSTSMPIEPDEAEEAYIRYTVTNPPLMGLDLLCDYKRYGDAATYENVEAKLLDAGAARSSRHLLPAQDCEKGIF
jgi:hypothetical protein